MLLPTALPYLRKSLAILTSLLVVSLRQRGLFSSPTNISSPKTRKTGTSYKYPIYYNSYKLNLVNTILP